jgi:uncharacterized membrane protein
MEQRSHSAAETVRRGHPRHRDEWGIEFSRIVAFSDGVFAIAITLLVLTINIPEELPANTTVGELIEDQNRDFIAYAISFAVVGKLWLTHHRFFSAVERFDGVLMGLNLVYLGWIVLVPFTSAVLGDYGENSTGVITYALVMVAVSLTFHAQLMYAYRNDLIRPELREIERRLAVPSNLVVTAVFVLSIPVALVSPVAATAMWPVIFFTGRRFEGWLARLRS